MSTLAVPNRQMRPQQPRVVAALTLDGRPLEVGGILARIQRVNRAPPYSPAYLFVTPGGLAYVLHNEHMALQQWMRSHLSWFVGCYDYRRGPMRPLEPDAAGLEEDVGQHLRDLGVAVPFAA